MVAAVVLAVPADTEVGRVVLVDTEVAQVVPAVLAVPVDTEVPVGPVDSPVDSVDIVRLLPDRLWVALVSVAGDTDLHPHPAEGPMVTAAAVACFL